MSPLSALQHRDSDLESQLAASLASSQALRRELSEEREARHCDRAAAAKELAGLREVVEEREREREAWVGREKRWRRRVEEMEGEMEEAVEGRERALKRVEQVLAQAKAAEGQLEDMHRLLRSNKAALETEREARRGLIPLHQSNIHTVLQEATPTAAPPHRTRPHVAAAVYSTPMPPRPVTPRQYIVSEESPAISDAVRRLAELEREEQVLVQDTRLLHSSGHVCTRASIALPRARARACICVRICLHVRVSRYVAGRLPTFEGCDALSHTQEVKLSLEEFRGRLIRGQESGVSALRSTVAEQWTDYWADEANYREEYGGDVGDVGAEEEREKEEGLEEDENNNFSTMVTRASTMPLELERGRLVFPSGIPDEAAPRMSRTHAASWLHDINPNPNPTANNTTDNNNSNPNLNLNNNDNAISIDQDGSIELAAAEGQRGTVRFDANQRSHTPEEERPLVVGIPTPIAVHPVPQSPKAQSHSRPDEVEPDIIIAHFIRPATPLSSATSPVVAVISPPPRPPIVLEQADTATSPPANDALTSKAHVNDTPTVVESSVTSVTAAAVSPHQRKEGLYEAEEEVMDYDDAFGIGLDELSDGGQSYLSLGGGRQPSDESDGW
eukprot:jgi/Chlat1/2627/Chrsp178S02468